MESVADLVNGAYELLGGVMLFHNCWTLYRSKRVEGVSVLTVAFFTSWGFWNLFYYPSLAQWASFTGGLAIVSANVLWVAMALHYRRKQKAAEASDRWRGDVLRAAVDYSRRAS